MCDASARMVASQLDRQIVLWLKRPLAHYWSSPLRATQGNFRKMEWDVVTLWQLRVYVVIMWCLQESCHVHVHVITTI